MAFESVKESGVTWNPCSTGKKKDGTLKPLEATDKSFVIGYFKGTKTGAGQEGKSTVHTLQLTEVGDPAHLGGDVSEGEDIVIWGTGVLNDLMSKVPVGAFVQVMWTGKKTSKITGNPYHNWEVGIDKSAEPISVKAEFSADTVSAGAVENKVAASVADGLDEDEDDLPF